MVTKAEWDSKINRYKSKYRKHGVSPKSLGWWNKTSVEKRFTAIVKELDFEWYSILDVGCGFGDFYSALAMRFDKFKYTGVDIVSDFVAVARKKHNLKNIEFECMNFFETDSRMRYDVVVCSGVLNSALTDPNRFRKEAIAKLYKVAKKALVFNMAGAFPQPENKGKSAIYYSDSLEVLKYCYSLTNKVTYNCAYLPKDFTIAMYK